VTNGQFSDAQIIEWRGRRLRSNLPRGAVSKQAEGGTPISELCREHGMSSASFYKWRAKFGGMPSRQITL
jgi:putative transposase